MDELFGASDADSGTVDTWVLESARAKEQTGWKIIDARYGAKIRSICRRKEVAESDVDELAQDVIGKVFENFNSFSRDKDGQSLGAWIATVTVNVAMDYHRRRIGRPQATGGTDAQNRLVELLAYGRPDDDSLDFNPNQKLAESFLAYVRPYLTTSEESALDLVILGGLSVKDVAEQLGVGEEAIKKRKERALARLRVHIEAFVQEYVTSER